MHVFVDEEVCQTGAATISEAVAAGAALAQRSGRIIVEILVDGAPWSADAPASSDAASASPNEIRMISARPADLVCQTFQDAADALADADRLQQSAAELMQAGNLPMALDQLNRAFSIWLSVQQAVTMGSELVGLNLDQSIGDRQVPVRGVIDELRVQLQAVHSAMESKDTVALADTLLYDLPHVVARWRGLLMDLQTMVRSNA